MQGEKMIGKWNSKRTKVNLIFTFLNNEHIISRKKNLKKLQY